MAKKSSSRKGRRGSPATARKRKVDASAKMSRERLDVTVTMRWLKVVGSHVVTALAGYGLIDLIR